MPHQYLHSGYEMYMASTSSHSDANAVFVVELGYTSFRPIVVYHEASLFLKTPPSHFKESFGSSARPQSSFDSEPQSGDIFRSLIFGLIARLVYEAASRRLMQSPASL